MVIKWKLNGIDLERNPTSFAPNFAKNVNYISGVSGKTIRSVPTKNKVSKMYNAEWSYVGEEMRNLLHDLYVQDKDFILKSHLVNNNREAWRMKIDSFQSEYVVSGSKEQLFDISCSFKVLSDENDPIIVRQYSVPSYPFVVDNQANVDIFDAAIFVFGINKDIDGISITSTDLNLISNPGFEQVEGLNVVYKWEGNLGDWQSDIVLFYEGERCLRTYKLNSPIRQAFACPEGETLHVTWAAMGDVSGNNKVRLRIVFLNSSNSQIGVHDDVRSITSNWQEFVFSTVATPVGTVKARVEISKISGTSDPSDFVYVDRVHVGLDGAEYTNSPHKTLVYNEEIPKGKTLKLDMIAESAHIDGEDVSRYLSGEFFPLTMGKSVLVFEELEHSAGNIEAIVRYNEVYG